MVVSSIGSIFLLFLKVIKEVKGICRSFLWSGHSDEKKTPVAWDTLCLKKSL